MRAFAPRQAELSGQRLEVRRQRRRLDRHVDPRQGTKVIALQMVVGRPVRGRGRQGRHELDDPRRVTVGLGGDHRLLPEQVDGVGAALAPEPLQAVGGLGRRLADDELARHPGDVPAGDGCGEVVAERQVLGHPDPEVEQPWHVGAVEVLGRVAQDVVVVHHRREGVDEPEELGLERWATHRPVHHPVGNRRAPEELRASADAELGEPPGDAPDRVLEPLVEGTGRHGRTVPTALRRRQALQPDGEEGVIAPDELLTLEPPANLDAGHPLGT